MKKHFRLMITLSLVFAMTLMLASCQKKAEPEAEPDDGQNPVMNFVGNYVCDRASILVEADGDTGAKATVTWGNSADSNVVWTMSGEYAADSHEFTYKDCVKTEYRYNEDGSVAEEKEQYNDGTGTMIFSEGNAGPYLEWKDDKENAAEGMTFTFNAGGGGETGIANPWSSAANAEEAAEGAGLDKFVVPAGAEISLGPVNVMEYRYMEGIAEADIPIAAVEMTIRKGKASGADVADGDISGDYNEYKHEWTTKAGDAEVKCFGNEEGAATKAIWGSGEYYYSITAYGAGGEDDFGLSEEDLTALVKGIG